LYSILKNICGPAWHGHPSRFRMYPASDDINVFEHLKN
jgi:hypothetical protein